ncbi:glycosyltransferase family 4 protein [Vibrio sp. 14N.309.X.WAT.E.F5]|uniref:glycosyltransferase family 4 protein n=1 Tax=Vibrio TaxID=662 RepID=UPI000C840CB4|nr:MULTISPECIES: glycosyltransferase family 4 protein [Vibrio]MDN2668853.1 glycosyltransferase family 4 protein [Vibrio sp. 14N.309.X.WAT.E.F5]PMJ87290.1 glycosyl transferase family 1 [Vibrio lentus]
MSTTKPNIPPNNVNEPLIKEALIPVLGEIWLFIDSQTFGGIETHVLELAKGLLDHRKKVRVVLLTQYMPEPSIIGRLNESALPYSYLQDLSKVQGNPIAQLRSAVEQYQPQLIHAHGYKASIVSKSTKLLSRQVPLRQISTYHAGETPTGRVWVYDLLDRYTSWISNHSLVVSSKISRKLPTRSTLLNNFVSIPADSQAPALSDTQQAQNNQHGHYQFGFVGRLSHEKAADRFIMLAKNFEQHQFNLFGDGPERSKLAQNSPANCQFHGHQIDMASVWPRIDVLIIPSRYEGLPMAALEAMVRGIPVIATAVGNLPQLIDHGSNGYISHSESELTANLNAWLNLSPSDKEIMSAKARQSVIDDYSPQAVIPQLLNCYHL